MKLLTLLNKYFSVSFIRIAVLWAAMSAAGINGFAQPNGYDTLENPAAFKEKLKARAIETKSLQSEFTQEKHLSFFSEDIVTKGKFAFKKDNLLRWEYNDPFTYLVILNGDEVLIRDDQQTTTFDARSNQVFQQVNDLMLGMVDGNILDNPDFSAGYFENKSFYLVELTPVKEEMKQFLRKVHLTIDKAAMDVVKLKMFETGEDFTTIAFHNRKVNSDLPDDKFQLK